MRRLPAIVALTFTLDCVATASIAAAWPVCFSCGSSGAVARDHVVLAMGGGDGGTRLGGGMHCGPGCGGGRDGTGGGAEGGMGGGAGGGMGGGVGGGMGGLGGGMGAGAFGAWDPFLRVPRANCSEERRKLGHRRKPESSACADRR